LKTRVAVNVGVTGHVLCQLVRVYLWQCVVFIAHWSFCTHAVIASMDVWFETLKKTLGTSRCKICRNK